jgi:hypothetical protein
MTKLYNEKEEKAIPKLDRTLPKFIIKEGQKYVA